MARWKPRRVSFPTRGGSIFSDENCARRSLRNSNVQYALLGTYTYYYSTCILCTQDREEHTIIVVWALDLGRFQYYVYLGY